MKRPSWTAGWTNWVRDFITTPPSWRSWLVAWKSLKRVDRLQRGGWKPPSTRLKSRRLWDHRYQEYCSLSTCHFHHSLITALIWLHHYYNYSYLLCSGMQCEEPGATEKSAGESKVPEASGGLPQRPGPGAGTGLTTDSRRQHWGHTEASGAGQRNRERLWWRYWEGEGRGHGQKKRHKVETCCFLLFNMLQFLQVSKVIIG